MTLDPDLHDHLRPSTADYPPGTYRVVGDIEGTVTLLRLTDGDGERTNSGEIEHVPRSELSGFETAEDPDAGLSPVGRIRSLVDGMAHLLRDVFG